MLAELLLSVFILFAVPPCGEEMVYEETVDITAYCPSGNLTASGTVPVAYHTIAASEKYDIGTELYIEDIGYCIVEDRGGPLIQSGERIDLFVNSEEEAIEFGVQPHKVYRVNDSTHQKTNNSI